MTHQQQETEMASAKRMQQTDLPGIPSEADIPDEVRDARYQLETKIDDLKSAARAKKEAHECLLGRMDEHGIEIVPYVDSITGKKRHAKIDTKRVVKLINAPSQKQQRKAEREADRDRPEIDAVIADPNADKVEARRVPRATVEAELAERDAKIREADGEPPMRLVRDEAAEGDPFAATRARMDLEVATGAVPTGETEH